MDAAFTRCGLITSLNPSGFYDAFQPDGLTGNPRRYLAIDQPDSRDDFENYHRGNVEALHESSDVQKGLEKLGFSTI